jgi:hypothetical protein
MVKVLTSMTSEHSFQGLQQPSHNSFSIQYYFKVHWNLTLVEQTKSVLCTAVYTSTRYNESTHEYIAVRNLHRWSMFLTQQKRNWNQVGFEVLTAVVLNVAIASCSPYTNRRFGGKYQLHLHWVTCCTLVSCLADFRSWRWRLYVPPKRRFTYELHGTISQKMATLMISNNLQITVKLILAKRNVYLHCTLLQGEYTNTLIDLISSNLV